MTGVCLFYSIVFFVFNVGFNIVKKEKKIHTMMEKLKTEQLLHRDADPELDEDKIKLVEHEMDENGKPKKGTR
jgi:hypothetical protein